MIQLIENLQELLNNNLFHISQSEALQICKSTIWLINQYLFVRKNKISFKDIFYYLTPQDFLIYFL
jgi:hypothetical protein